MSMSVLEMAKAVSYKVGVEPPTQLVGTTQPGSLRFIALLTDEARHLRNQKVFPQQKKAFTLNTADGDGVYELPSDFYSPSPDTFFDGQTRQQFGFLNDYEYNNRLFGFDSSAGEPGVRIFGVANGNGQLNIAPTPTSAGTYTFEYVTRNLFYDSTFTNGSETIGADTNVSIFDDDIMIKGVEWRYRESKGMEYQMQQAEHERLIASAVARWSGPQRGTFGGNRWIGPRYSLPNGSWPI